MERRTLGRTGINATVMGLGCGGPSRLGQRTGVPWKDSVAVVKRAIELGINFFDTAEGYGTEGIVGEAIEGYDRGSLFISTKKSTIGGVEPGDVLNSVQASLARLRTDYIDLYSLHAVTPAVYDSMVTDVYPELKEVKDEGLIRFIGVTEFFNRGTRHDMLQRALKDDLWDVVMVGFNILNQSARARVFPAAMGKDIGTLIMFPVRRALSRPQRLREVIAELVARGEVDPEDIDAVDPLGFLIHEGGATSVVDAAYRFCRDEPGVDVVLSGTGSIEHLEQNVESFSRPALPEYDVTRLKEIFRRVDSITGE